MSYDVRIEQKIDVPGRLFFFSTDDALVALIPVAIGFLSRNLIAGFVFGVLAYFLWRKVKGEGGLIGRFQDPTLCRGEGRYVAQCTEPSI